MLFEKNYHKAVDIWAVGVIIIELFRYLNMSPEDRKKQKKKNNFQVFDAKRCFPLSPRGTVFDEKDGLPVTEGDLLESVFDFIGTP